MSTVKTEMCYDDLVKDDVKSEVNHLVSSNRSKVYTASKLAKFFSIDLTIRIFGYPIIEWHYPPQGSDVAIMED